MYPTTKTRNIFTFATAKLFLVEDTRSVSMKRDVLFIYLVIQANRNRDCQYA